jgi:hypothetical protein
VIGPSHQFLLWFSDPMDIPGVQFAVYAYSSIWRQAASI